MKKMISFIVAVTLMLSFAAPAYATTIDDFVEKAAGEVGTSYDMDSNRDYYIWEETKYGKWFSDQRNWLERLYNGSYYVHEAPWCTMFVSWCSDQAGLGIPRYSAVTEMKNWYNSEGRYHNRLFYTPKKGDVVFFADDNGQDSHVGIVENVEICADVPFKDGQWIKMTTIEGDYIHWQDGQKSCSVDRVSHELRTSRPWECDGIIGFGEN